MKKRINSQAAAARLYSLAVIFEVWPSLFDSCEAILSGLAIGWVLQLSSSVCIFVSHKLANFARKFVVCAALKPGAKVNRQECEAIFPVNLQLGRK
jgi:hypothetical protein